MTLLKKNNIRCVTNNIDWYTRLYLFYLLVNIELLPRLPTTDLKHLQSFYPLRPWQTRTHSCWHIVADTNHSPFARARNICCGHKFVSGTQKMFMILFRSILCPQQMFPSLRSSRNIMGNNVSATMCPRLPGPLDSYCTILYKRECWQPPPSPSPAGHKGLWLGESEC